MMIRFALIALLMAPAAALAQSSSGDHLYQLAPGTYAARALCTIPEGQSEMVVYLPDQGFGTPIAQTGSYCVNGRLGVTFSVPSNGAPTRQVDVLTFYDRVLPDIRLHIDRDCPEAPSPECFLTSSSGNDSDPAATFVANGRITFPGDVDWYEMRATMTLYRINTIPSRAGCFATARVVEVPSTDPTLPAGRYLAVSGGPSGCGYQVRATHRPGFFG